MSLEEFDDHLRDPAPGFRCYSCTDRSEQLTYIARVGNHLGNPATPDTLTFLSSSLGLSLSGLTHFVQMHDGVSLYQDKNSEAAGIAFFEATEWQSRTEEMRDSIREMGFDEEEMPDWFHQGVVFGEIPHSGNYFLIKTHGEKPGEIYYFDHDDLNTEPIAPTFEDFLAGIVRDPAGFLYERGCYTRYSDGNTEIQWIPKVYLGDCGHAEPDPGVDRGNC